MSEDTSTLPLGTKSHHTTRFRAGGWEELTDVLAIEAPLEMRLQPAGQPARAVSITMRTPGQDADLILGYLLSEGILRRAEDVAAIQSDDPADAITVVLREDTTVDWSRLDRQGFASSSCGVCGKASLDRIRVDSPFAGSLPQWTISGILLRQLPARLRARQEVFARTGGIHGAGLFDRSGELVAYREDVGRHNALDKLLGYACAQGWLPLHDYVILLSGRASFELVQKAAVAGVPVVVAVGAPSSLAVSTAEAAGITLAGFAARERLNVYCGRERLDFDS